MSISLTINRRWVILIRLLENGTYELVVRLKPK